ncbi:MAG: hypothetical protein HN909_00575 [Phycisphaerales bacterium]|jgi:hypothetical protein|nr:hypothetical protein [Phycisphaerales bacterium]MBT7170243.1 hypothetical protein [Phycisphaerales bacterium]
MKRHLPLICLILLTGVIAFPVSAARNKKPAAKPTKPLARKPKTTPAAAAAESAPKKPALSKEKRDALIEELKATKNPTITIKGLSNTFVEFEGTPYREGGGLLYLRTPKKKTITLYPTNIVEIKITVPDALQTKLDALSQEEQTLILAGWMLDRYLLKFAEYHLLNSFLGGKLHTTKYPPIAALYKEKKRAIPPLFGGKLPRGVTSAEELLPRIMPTTRAILEENKKQEMAYATQMKAIAPLTHRVETDHFVIYSAWAKKDDAVLVKIYNRLYPLICKQYLMDSREHIWAGKLPIYAFWTMERFQKFSKDACGVNLAAAGFAAQRGHFNYIVLGPVMRNGLTRAQAQIWFAELLSHETSHAFLSRYHGHRSVPSWLNEGLAEIVASILSPRGNTIRKMGLAHDAIRKGKRFNTSFFTERVALDDNGVSYGAAQSLARYLAKRDMKGFLKLVLEIKKGSDVEKSLKDIYKMDYQALLIAWQKAVLGRR